MRKKRLVVTVLMTSLLGGSFVLSSCNDESSSLSYIETDKVISLLNSLNDSSTKEEIEAARKAYDSLSSEDKANIPSSILSKLAKQETRIANIESSKMVIDLISALGEGPSEEAVNKAKEAYYALNEDAKGLVTNLDKLLSAIKRIEYKKEAEGFANKIKSIDLSTLTAEAIQTIQEEYDSLSEEAKALLDNETKEKYQQILVELDRQAAKAFEDKVNNADPYTIGYEEIVSLKNEYDSLTEKSKSFLKEETVSKYNQILANIDKKAKELVNRIDALLKINDNDYLFLSKKEEIQNIRSEYDSLPNELKEKVTNIDKLANLDKIVSSYSSLLGLEDEPLRLRGDSEQYSYPKSFVKGNDENYGITLDLTLNQATQNYALEIYFNKSINSETIGEYDKLFFYFYNPGDAAVNMCLGDTAWNRFGDSTTTYGKGWHKVEASTKAILNNKADAKIDTITSGWALFNTSITTGWRITPIYGYKDIDNYNFKKINSIIASLPTSLEGTSDYEKMQSISKLAFARKMLPSIDEELKAKLDIDKLNSLVSTYDKVGEVIYGINDVDTITPIETEKNKGSILGIDFDYSSSFASNFGQCYKIQFKTKSPMSVYEFALDNLKVDFSSYSSLCLGIQNDLCEWGDSKEYGDYAYLIDDDIDLDLVNNKANYGLPGFYKDDGFGKGTSFFKYEIDKNKESNSFKSPRFVYQNSWTATVNNYLYYSPLVALK